MVLIDLLASFYDTAVAVCGTKDTTFYPDLIADQNHPDAYIEDMILEGHYLYVSTPGSYRILAKYDLSLASDGGVSESGLLWSKNDVTEPWSLYIHGDMLYVVCADYDSLRVERRNKNTGALITYFSSASYGYGGSGLVCDGTYAYVSCTSLVNGKPGILKLSASSLAIIDSYWMDVNQFEWDDSFPSSPSYGGPLILYNGYLYYYKLSYLHKINAMTMVEVGNQALFYGNEGCGRSICLHEGYIYVNCAWKVYQIDPVTLYPFSVLESTSLGTRAGAIVASGHYLWVSTYTPYETSSYILKFDIDPLAWHEIPSAKITATLGASYQVQHATCLVRTDATVDIYGPIPNFVYAEYGYNQIVNQRSPFYTAGRWWLPVVSKDGSGYGTEFIMWSAPPVGSWWPEVVFEDPDDYYGMSYGSYFGPNLDTWFDGTYFHYAVLSEVGNPRYVAYRRGTLQSDGTISWSEEQYFDTSGTVHVQLSLCIDSGGYPWVALCDDTNNRITIYKSSTNDGTWTTDSGFPQEWGSGTSSLIWQQIIPLTSGKVYVAWVDETNYQFKGCLYDGANFGDVEIIQTWFGDINTFMINAIGDTVYFINTPEDYDLNETWIEVKKRAGDGTWSQIQRHVVAGGGYGKGVSFLTKSTDGELWAMAAIPYVLADAAPLYAAKMTPAGVWSDWVLIDTLIEDYSFSDNTYTSSASTKPYINRLALSIQQEINGSLSRVLLLYSTTLPIEMEYPPVYFDDVTFSEVRASLGGLTPEPVIANAACNFTYGMTIITGQWRNCAIMTLYDALTLQPVAEHDTYFVEAIVIPYQEYYADNNYIFARLMVTIGAETFYYPLGDSGNPDYGLENCPVQGFAAGKHSMRNAIYFFVIPKNIAGATVTLQLRLEPDPGRMLYVKSYMVGWGFAPHHHDDT